MKSRNTGIPDTRQQTTPDDRTGNKTEWTTEK